MTNPIDSILAKLAARRGFIAPEIAEQLLREAADQGGAHLSQLLIKGGWCTPAQVELLTQEAAKHGQPPVIGGYQLVSKLGQGGMGVVYQATQLSMQRAVALKVLAAHLNKNREFAERFLREAHAAGRVVHPNVVGCHDAGEDGGHLFMALEYVAGGDADRLLKEHGRLPERRALEIARDCAAGLEALHSVGLIHRDIKPGNIFLDLQGQAKLGDLGLARSIAGEDRLTMTGTAIGTPAFMSPEQANGDADLDIRSDVYSLGASLFQLLTGEPPYRGNSSWAVVAKAINEPFPDPRSFCSDISEAAASVVLCAAAKDRAKRHATPTALREDLELLLAGQGPRHAPLVRSVAGTADPSLATVMVPAGGAAPATGVPAPRRPRPRTRVEGGRAGLWIGVGLLVLSVAVVALVLHHGRERRQEAPTAPAAQLVERIVDVPPMGPRPLVTVPAKPVAVAPPAPPPVEVPTPPLVQPAQPAPVAQAAPIPPPAAPRSLLTNGGFEILDGGLPRDWQIENPGVSVKGGSDGRWLAITRSAGQDQPTASAVVTIPRDARFMRVTARVRASGVRRGSEDWHLPGIFIHIRDGAGARVDRPTAPALLLERDTAAWTVMVSEFPVPRAGDVVQIHLTVCGPSGTLEVDDVVVEADPK